MANLDEFELDTLKSAENSGWESRRNVETKKIIAITYNTCHYIYMFRLNLIHTLQKAGYSIIAIAPYDEYSDKLEREGVSHIPVNIDNKGTSPLADLRLIKNLFTIYKEIKPDIILQYTIKPNIYGSIAARLIGIPVINNITGLGTVFLNEGLVQKITKILYRFSFQRVKKVFFQNNYDRQLFLDNDLVDKLKVDLLPGSGIDTKKFTPLINMNKNDKFTFLLIARVIQDKGIMEYVEAAKQITNNHSNVEFQILGQLGAINKSVINEEEVESWQSQGIINYLGSTDDVRNHIAQADCIVLPSYREGTSKTLLEAASMAKPIVATDVPGCNNIVSDGVNGFLCKVKNSMDLASKMEMMMNLSENQREAMGNNGRKKMMDEFEEEIVIQKYLKEIKKILKEENKK